MSSFQVFMIAYPIIMFSIVGVVLLFVIMRARNRIRIRIKTPVGEKEIWRAPNVSGDKVTIFKGSKKVPKWELNFDHKALYFTKKFFMKVPTIDTFANSEKAFIYDFDKLSIDKPKYDKDTANKWLHSEAITKYGEGLSTKQNQLFLIALISLVLVIVVLALNFIQLIKGPI